MWGFFFLKLEDFPGRTHSCINFLCGTVFLQMDFAARGWITAEEEMLTRCQVSI